MVAFYKVAVAIALGMMISVVLLFVFTELRSITREIKVTDVDLGSMEFKETQLYLTLYIYFYNAANMPIAINELKYNIYFETSRS